MFMCAVSVRQTSSVSLTLYPPLLCIAYGLLLSEESRGLFEEDVVEGKEEDEESAEVVVTTWSSIMFVASVVAGVTEEWRKKFSTVEEYSRSSFSGERVRSVPSTTLGGSLIVTGGGGVEKIFIKKRGKRSNTVNPYVSM